MEGGKTISVGRSGRRSRSFLRCSTTRWRTSPWSWRSGRRTTCWTELGIPPDDTLYGFYHGVPLPERSVQDSGLLPDKISVYRGPLVEDFPDRNELGRQIRITLLHEIGHYFGMDEEELSRLGYE